MWSTHVTVAAVIAQGDRFLLVRETDKYTGQEVINQPAGHLEEHETLIEAVIRETLEETGWHVQPTGFLGISQYQAANAQTYLRASFTANALRLDESRPLDEGIISADWLSLSEIENEKEKLRSPLVLNDIQRYLDGQHHSLESIFFATSEATQNNT